MIISCFCQSHQFHQIASLDMQKLKNPWQGLSRKATHPFGDRNSLIFSLKIKADISEAVMLSYPNLNGLHEVDIDASEIAFYRIVLHIIEKCDFMLCHKTKWTSKNIQKHENHWQWQKLSSTTATFNTKVISQSVSTT